MRGIKAMKIRLSASRQNLDNLPWLGFEWLANEIVGAAKLSTIDNTITFGEMEDISESVIYYLTEKTGYVEHGGSFSGPFIFSFKNEIDILQFMREMRIDMKVYGEFGNVTLKFKFQ